MLRRNKPLTRKKPLRAMRAPRTEKHTDPAADAKRKLWPLLEGREVAGLSFHHHERIGPYVADFVSPAARLVLLLTNEETGDDGRADWLRSNGYRVLEFPVREVLTDPHAVLETVARSLELRIVSRKS